MRLHSIEVNMTHMAANMATKADLANLASKDDLNEFIRASGKDMQDLAVSFHKAINDQTWKFIAVAGVLAGLAFTAARFIQ
jgi:arsenate reductase-like glutaredoxin family protein